MHQTHQESTGDNVRDSTCMKSGSLSSGRYQCLISCSLEKLRLQGGMLGVEKDMGEKRLLLLSLKAVLRGKDKNVFKLNRNREICSCFKRLK